MKKDKLKNALSGIVGSSEKPEAAADGTPEAETTPTAEASSSMEVEPTTTQDETDLINTIQSEALREALHKKRMDGRGRPRKNTDPSGKRTDGYSRTSLIVNDELWAKIKEVSFRETLTMKEIIDLALRLVIERYEAKHGTIEPQPEKYNIDINKVF